MGEQTGSFIHNGTLYTFWSSKLNGVIELTRTAKNGVDILVFVVDADGTVLVGGICPCGVITYQNNTAAFTLIGESVPGVFISEYNKATSDIHKLIEGVFLYLCVKVTKTDNAPTPSLPRRNTMAKNLLDTFTHEGVVYSQYIDTNTDSVEITTSHCVNSDLIITFDSSCNVLAENGMRLGHISGFCDDEFTFTLEGGVEPVFAMKRNKSDPEFIFKFEKAVFYFLIDYVQWEKTAKCGEVTTTFTERYPLPNKEKINTVQDQVKLHGCKIGDEIKPSQKQRSWLRSEHIHTSSNAEFTGAPGSNPGVQLSRSDIPFTWIPAPVKEACGVERVNDKWCWLIKSDDVGDVEGIRSFCLGSGELRCDGCGQEKNWVALNKLPDEKRLAIQANAKRIDDMACIILQRPWYSTLPEPVVDAVVTD